MLGATPNPCATVPEPPAYVTIENPLVVFADILVAAIDPAKFPVKLEPSIFTLPAVGAAPALEELSAVGAVPASQFQAT